MEDAKPFLCMGASGIDIPIVIWRDFRSLGLSSGGKSSRGTVNATKGIWRNYGALVGLYTLFGNVSFVASMSWPVILRVS